MFFEKFSGGGTITPHGFSFINQEFIITANNTKPLLHIWPVNSQEQVSGLRFVVPGKVAIPFLRISSNVAKNVRKFSKFHLKVDVFSKHFVTNGQYFVYK